MARGEALPRPRRLAGSLGSSLSLASLPPSEASRPPPSRPPPSRHRSDSRAPSGANTPSGVGATPRVPPPSLSAVSCEPPDDALRSSEALPPTPPPPPPQPKGVESSGWREEDVAQMGEKVSEPPLGVSDAFARLEREALSGGVGAFARLEREALRMEEMGTTTDLGLLRRNVQQLQADARVHVLLERDERKELERQRAKINELQQAFHSLANLIVGEMEDIRVAQRKQQAQIDRIMTTHRDLATLEQEEWAAMHVACRIHANYAPTSHQEIVELARVYSERSVLDDRVRVLLEADKKKDRVLRDLRVEINELREQANRDREAMGSIMRLAQRNRGEVLESHHRELQHAQESWTGYED